MYITAIDSGLVSTIDVVSVKWLSVCIRVFETVSILLVILWQRVRCLFCVVGWVFLLCIMDCVLLCVLYLVCDCYKRVVYCVSLVVLNCVHVF